MEESWLEELQNKKDDEFLKSSHAQIDNNKTGSARAPPPPPPGPRPIPKVVQETSMDAEDDLDIDRVHKTNAPVLPAKPVKEIPKKVEEPTPPTTTGAKKKLDPSEQLKASLFKMNLAAVIIGVVSSFIILFCIRKSYRSFDQETFPFASIQESWRREVIMRFDRAMDDKNCPAGMSNVNMLDWPGTVEACDCTAQPQKTLYAAKCTDDQLRANCKPVSRVSSSYLSKWNGTLLCKQTIPLQDMNTLVKNSDFKTGLCKKGFKMCPESPYDPIAQKLSKSWAVCFDETKACPITDVEVGLCKTNPNIECYNATSKVELSKDNCLWYSNRCGRGPVIRLAAGEGGICRLETQNQIISGHKEYDLLVSKRKGCEHENENTLPIHSLKQEEVLKQNGIPVDSLPGYKANIDPYNYTLFKVNYHKWVWAHRDENDIKLIQENGKKIDELKGTHLTAIYFFMLGLVIFLVISPALFYFENIKPDLYRTNRPLIFVKYLLLWFYKIAAVPVALYLMKINVDIYSKFHAYAEADFSNKFDNERIKKMANSLETGIYKWDRIALWVAVITICMDVAIMVLICRLESQKTRVDEVDLNQSLTDGVEMSKQ